jgi:tetratricopeptide (TPR) repeat protein
LNIAREIGNKPWEAKTLNQIGRYFHRQGDYVRAQSYYDQSRQIYHQVGNQLSEGRVMADLSLLYHHLGDDETAKETSAAALAIADELNHPRLLGRSLMQLGRAQAGLEQLDEALHSYQRAGDFFQDLGQQNLSVEVWAGTSLVYIAKDDLSEALKLTDKILHHLENSQVSEITVLDAERGPVQQAETGALPGLEGTNDPHWIYLTCFRVLKANSDDRAADILSAALELLREQASKIEDADLQYSFMNNVKVNREIQAESESGGAL